MIMVDNDADTTTTAADELAAFIRHESVSGDNVRLDGEIRRHALEQLVEARLGGDMTSTAHQIIAADISANDEKGWSNAATQLSETSSFQLVQSIVEECSLKLGPSESARNDNEVMASKKAKIPAEESAAPAAKSFSLFDMLDSQKSGGGGSLFASLPPRVMAYQVIEAHEHEKKQNTANANDGAGDTTYMAAMDAPQKSALELLEKADDMEDLSPDPDSWEEIRSILYVGLTNSGGNDEKRFRYVKVHKSLFEKCQGNNACKAQLWGLAQNLVGSILALSHHIEQQSECDGDGISTPLRHTMDLCWDISQALITSVLPQLAMDHVVSSVGSEREIERMLLGLCMILSNDFSSCIFGMMEPLAGWFEVWIRFVDPKTLVTMLHASGLGGVMLQRCKTLGRNTSSALIGETMAESSTGDIEHCNFLQSLSILRSMLFRCGGSKEVLSLLHRQFTSEAKDSVDLASFLFPNGVASIDDVQSLLKRVEEVQKESKDAMQIDSIDDSVKIILTPFCHVIAMKERRPSLVSSELEVLCTQTIDLVQDLQTG